MDGDTAGMWAGHPASPEFWKLMKQFQQKNILCDITLHFRDKVTGRTLSFPAHKIVLVCGSAYFRLHLEKKQLTDHFILEDADSDSFPFILNYLYGNLGQNVSKQQMQKIVKLAEKLQINSHGITSRLLKKTSTQPVTEATKLSASLRRTFSVFSARDDHVSVNSPDIQMSDTKNCVTVKQENNQEVNKERHNQEVSPARHHNILHETVAGGRENQEGSKYKQLALSAHLSTPVLSDKQSCRDSYLEKKTEKEQKLQEMNASSASESVRTMDSSFVHLTRQLQSGSLHSKTPDIFPKNFFTDTLLAKLKDDVIGTSCENAMTASLPIQEVSDVQMQVENESEINRTSPDPATDAGAVDTSVNIRKNIEEKSTASTQEKLSVESKDIISEDSVPVLPSKRVLDNSEPQKISKKAAVMKKYPFIAPKASPSQPARKLLPPVGFNPSRLRINSAPSNPVSRNVVNSSSANITVGNVIDSTTNKNVAARNLINSASVNITAGNDITSPENAITMSGNFRNSATTNITVGNVINSTNQNMVVARNIINYVSTNMTPENVGNSTPKNAKNVKSGNLINSSSASVVSRKRINSSPVSAVSSNVVSSSPLNMFTGTSKNVTNSVPVSARSGNVISSNPLSSVSESFINSTSTSVTSGHVIGSNHLSGAVGNFVNSVPISGILGSCNVINSASIGVLPSHVMNTPPVSMVSGISANVMNSAPVGDMSGNMVNSASIGILPGHVMHTPPVCGISANVMNSAPVGDMSGNMVNSAPIGILPGHVVNNAPISGFSANVINSAPVSDLSGNMVNSASIGILSGSVMNTTPVSGISANVINPAPVPIHLFMRNVTNSPVSAMPENITNSAPVAERSGSNENGGPGHTTAPSGGKKIGITPASLNAPSVREGKEVTNTELKANSSDLINATNQRDVNNTVLNPDQWGNSLLRNHGNRGRPTSKRRQMAYNASSHPPVWILPKPQMQLDSGKSRNSFGAVTEEQPNLSGLYHSQPVAMVTEQNNANDIHLSKRFVDDSVSSTCIKDSNHGNGKNEISPFNGENHQSEIGINTYMYSTEESTAFTSDRMADKTMDAQQRALFPVAVKEEVIDNSYSQTLVADVILEKDADHCTGFYGSQNQQGMLENVDTVTEHVLKDNASAGSRNNPDKHDKAKVFLCPRCNKPFKNFLTLNFHMIRKRQHGDQLHQDSCINRVSNGNDQNSTSGIQPVQHSDFTETDLAVAGILQEHDQQSKAENPAMRASSRSTAEGTGGCLIPRISTQKPNNMYPCHICRQMLPTKRSLGGHVRKVHPEAVNRKKDVKSDWVLSRLEAESLIVMLRVPCPSSGKPEFVFRCLICGIRFASNGTAIKHVKNHKSQKPKPTDFK